jgi:rRNA maturation protein Nop10
LGKPRHDGTESLGSVPFYFQGVNMKKSYWAVKWGDAIRISGKVYTAKEACVECYGMVANNMEVKNLGSVKSVIQSDTQRKELLTSASGWIRSKKTLLLLLLLPVLADCGRDTQSTVPSPKPATPTVTATPTPTAEPPPDTRHCGYYWCGGNQ